MTVAYTSSLKITKHQGAHRTAQLKGFDEPIHFGIHGGIKDFYQNKYGRKLTADVEGDVEDVDGVLKITKIRLKYSFKAPAALLEKAERALSAYAELCPAYQTVKDSVDCTWKADIETI
ncbi:MAG: OsmC family protein [Deltaproteobacteria bacterium]|nr:OsmC family protein [Deltaproteobacteria bacterium]